MKYLTNRSLFIGINFIEGTHKHIKSHINIEISFEDDILYDDTINACHDMDIAYWTITFPNYQFDILSQQFEKKNFDKLIKTRKYLNINKPTKLKEVFAKVFKIEKEWCSKNNVETTLC